MGFPGDVVVKNLPANARDAGDPGSIPGLERSPGGRKGKLWLQSMELQKSWTLLSDCTCRHNNTIH